MFVIVAGLRYFAVLGLCNVLSEAASNIIWATCKTICRQISNIRRTVVGKNIVDHSDVLGASPVGAAPTTSSFST